MSENGFAARGDGHFEVTGQLTFQTVPEVQTLAARLLPTDGRDVTIDLQGVTLADSAGLALLIEWMQLARRTRILLNFRNIPDQMRELIRVSGLSTFFDSN